MEYPNAWYLAKAEPLEKIFKDWVILFIKPHFLWHPDTRFCARNAAAGGGSQVVSGLEGFNSLYAPSILGAYGKNRTRAPKHLACSPTDDQAEVLIKSKIPLADIIGVAVKNEQQAKNEMARLKIAGIKPGIFQFVIAPVLFNKYMLSYEWLGHFGASVQDANYIRKIATDLVDKSELSKEKRILAIKKKESTDFLNSLKSLERGSKLRLPDGRNGAIKNIEEMFSQTARAELCKIELEDGQTIAIRAGLPASPVGFWPNKSSIVFHENVTSSINSAWTSL